MEITLIKINDNTLKISIEKVIDKNNEYTDKEILYDSDGMFIVCRYNSNSIMVEYKKLLIKALLNETVKDLNNVNEEVARLNKRYIGLVNKLI